MGQASRHHFWPIHPLAFVGARGGMDTTSRMQEDGVSIEVQGAYSWVKTLFSQLQVF